MFNYPIDNVGGKTGITNPREPKSFKVIILLQMDNKITAGKNLPLM